MTILTENDKSFFFTTSARLVDGNRDMASDWAATHIHQNPALKWVIGKYVEADNANSNGQYWSLADLQVSQPTIKYSPMNMGHHPTDIVGTFVASEMVYPDVADEHPYIETLGAFWKYYFPQDLADIEQAFKENSLFLSMECVSESVTCTGPMGCGQTFDYAGPMSQTYCQHIQDHASFRQLNNPHFLAGALILPPNRPGWKSAEVKDLAHSVSDETKDQIIQSIASEAPHLSASEWEKTMFAILEQGLSAERN